MVDVEGLVGDHEIVLSGLQHLVEDVEVVTHDLVHGAHGLEGVEGMLAALGLDVSRFAGQPGRGGMDPQSGGVEHPGYRMLGQPVDLHIGMECLQFAGDRDIAPRMPQTDGRGQIEHPLARRTEGGPRGDPDSGGPT
jgi:hypothetical protein